MGGAARLHRTHAVTGTFPAPELERVGGRDGRLRWHVHADDGVALPHGRGSRAPARRPRRRPRGSAPRERSGVLPRRRGRHRQVPPGARGRYQCRTLRHAGAAGPCGRECEPGALPPARRGAVHSGADGGPARTSRPRAVPGRPRSTRTGVAGRGRDRRRRVRGRARRGRAAVPARRRRRSRVSPGARRPALGRSRDARHRRVPRRQHGRRTDRAGRHVATRGGQPCAGPRAPTRRRAVLAPSSSSHGSTTRRSSGWWRRASA